MPQLEITVDEAVWEHVVSVVAEQAAVEGP